ERFFVELRAILIASDECAPLLLDLAQQERKRVVIRKLLLNCGERCDRLGMLAALHLLEREADLFSRALWGAAALGGVWITEKTLVVPNQRDRERVRVEGLLVTLFAWIEARESGERGRIVGAAGEHVR